MTRAKATEVPYSEAPPLRGSNFEKLKKLNLLDAKTHNFTGAWNEGYHRHRRHRRRARRRHRLRPPGPAQHLADLVRPDRRESRLERLAEGVRPVRHAAVAVRAGPDRQRPVLVREDRRRNLYCGSRPRARSTSPPRPARRATSRRRSERSSTRTASRRPGASPARSGSAATRTTTCSQLYGERPAFLVDGPAHRGRLRHDLRRPRQRLLVRRREAGHQEPRPRRTAT